MQVGGIIHSYQKYDPKRFPSPTQPPPDLASSALEQMLAYGDWHELTEEELAKAVRLDARQIAGLGPSLNALLAMLRDRKAKILAKYEVKSVLQSADRAFRDYAGRVRPPKPFRTKFFDVVRQQQILDIERLWYQVEDDNSPFAAQLMQLAERLGDKYEVEELASTYHFHGRESMTIPEAIEIKEELRKIDELIKQLEEARKNAQLAVIDMDMLAEFAEPQEMEQLSALQQEVQQWLRNLAEQQGLKHEKGAYRLTPKATRLFQNKLLSRIFSELTASRSGRHQGPVLGEGAVELPSTRPYEFGDSPSQMDIPQSFVNAMIRQGPGQRLQLRGEDIEIHRTRNTPKCASVVIMDMSGSMRYDGQYINAKRMALAMDGLIRSEFPGDFMACLEMYTFAKLVPPGEIARIMPKPVTIHQPWVRLKVDMARDDVSEVQVPPHFTNVQHALQLSRRLLATQPTPNRQVLLITDGLPTAHFEGSWLYLLYPPDPRTEEATMREAQACQREGITINIFLVPSWSQSREDIQFAHRLAESTKGRVFFTAGKDLDRYVVWDYVQRKRLIER
jgi:uncharacterized protein with von Willebrand factor type A (vWA) domain